MQEEYYNNNEIGGDTIKRPIVVIVIGYIIGIIWGLYFKSSIVPFYIIITFIYFSTKMLKIKKIQKFKLISIKRYVRYIKLFLTKQVICYLIISSIISNFIFILLENKYKNLYSEGEIELEGIIISNMEEREYKNRYKFQVLNVNNSTKYKNTKIYVEVDKDTIFKYGDRLVLKGEFRKGSKQRNYGGFDYELYLKSIGIYGTLKVESYQKIFEEDSNMLVLDIMAKINKLKEIIIVNIENNLEEDEAQIVKGLILGDTTALDERLKENFQISNISHVLAVSGMHIIYIVVGIEFVLKDTLGKRYVKFAIIFGLIFYMSITGFSSSIIRAGIMGIMNILAFLVYRKNDIWTSIALSLGIILMLNPYAITGVSLQLSYLGTIGIIIFNKSIRQYLDNIKCINNKVKNKKISKVIEQIKDILSVTISAQLMILPIMLYHFNLFGVYFILTNILVSIIIAPIMFLSIIFVFISLIDLFILDFISILLSLSIKILIQISNLASLPFSKIYVPTPSILLIILYYLFILIANPIYIIYTSKFNSKTQIRVRNLIALVKFRIYVKKKQIILKITNYNQKIKSTRCITKIMGTILIISCFIVFVLSINTKVFSNLEIHFLDVGQGDSCFIITPNNKTILIDGGGSTSSTFDVGKDTVIPYLLDKGYTKLDYIFISHFDQDHVGGILSIIEEFKVEKVFISRQEEKSENFKKFIEIVTQRKIKIEELKAGNQVKIGEIDFHILWPVEEQIEENKLNNNAMVMKLQYKDFSILFTGDIEEVAENKILDAYKDNLEILESTVLKVAHHGSKSSSTERFLQVVKAKMALIGVGENNMFGHPSNIVLDRLQTFRHTDF